MLLNTAAIILLLSAIALIIKTFLNFNQAKLNDLNRIAPSADLSGFYLLCAINPLAFSAVIRKVMTTVQPRNQLLRDKVRAGL
jgi:hypothetical protein